MTQLIKVENVCKQYGAEQNITYAVNNVSLSVEKGEFVAIMGASGSGKTTLLNSISTIDQVTSGNIYYEDVDITKMSDQELSKFRKNNLGFVFQDFNLLDTLTVEENIILSMAIHDKEKEEIDSKVKDISKKLGIEQVLKKFPYQISGGQKQRCACARAIINNPKLILADEPTGALDSKSARMLLETFETMNQKLGATILMVTHDVFSASYCQRILFMRDGQIQKEIKKGNKTKRQLLNDILDVMSYYGGNE